MMKSLSCNCRGLGSKEKLEMVCHLTKLEKPHLLLLQETKKQAEEVLKFTDLMWKNIKGRAISTVGSSGGLCTLWDPSIFNLINYKESTNWMLLQLNHSPSGMSLWFLNVYISCTPPEKQHCSNSLLSLYVELRGSNLIVARDFNTILYNKEKIGGNIVHDICRELMEYFTSSQDLIYIKPAKGKFTWSNNRFGSARIVTRLDRFFLSGPLLSSPFTPSSSILAWVGSDHRLISLLLTDP